MRFLSSVVAAALIAVGAGHAAPEPAGAEAEARAAYERYDQAWRTYNVDQIADDFADDFEWTNEVGLRFTDKARLKRFLTGLFKDADFKAGQSGELVIKSIRRLDADVVVILSSEETKGQIDSRTGKPVPSLHTNELAVLQRQGGRWVLVSVLDSDEAHGI